VKTEQIDELLPIAKKTYQALEQYLGVSLWENQNVLWSLSDTKEENDWHLRASQIGMEEYIVATLDVEKVLTKVKNVKNFGEVKQAARVNVALLISAYAEKLLSENRLLQAIFDFDLLQISPDGIQYEDIFAKKIIFCEGHRGRFNPLFQTEQFNVAKGEALIFQAKDLPNERILKNNITICPLSDGTFWAGSNYEWNATDSQPTAAIRSEFEQQLNSFLAVPFDIVAHRAAIRPTMKNRQIVTLIHQDFPNVAMFNGLGTKGTSLAPYWAKRFVKDFLQ
jgi:glycine oxidase